jgi:hypothetical protein
MQKKGDGNVFWIIIAAVLGLVALIVLLAILSGRLGDFQEDVGSCIFKGGVCRPIEADDAPGGCSQNEKEIQASCSEDQVCCIGLSAEPNR